MGKNKSPFEPKKATYFSPLNISHAIIKKVEKMILRLPEQMIGNVMTELQSRRAVIKGIDSDSNYQTIECTIPSAELTDFSSQLRSITQGRASYKTSFEGYSPVPAHVQKQLVEQQELITT